MSGKIVLRAFLDVKLVLLLIDTYDNGLGVVIGKDIVNDLLGAFVNGGLGSLLGEDPTSGITDIVLSKGTPPGLLGVAATGGVLLGYAVGGVMGSYWVAGCSTLQDGT